MSIFSRVTKAIKPVYGGNILFETLGVPAEQRTIDDLQRYNKTLHTVITSITDEVGNLDIELWKNDKQIESHWLLNLVNNPNPTMRLTIFNLWEYTQTYMELAGEAFWYMARGGTTGDPKLIFILRPDKMKLVIAKDGAIAGYVLRKDDGTNVPFELNEIIHFKTPNPMNLYRGFGATKASRDFIQTDDFASKWVRNSFYNNARPSALISLKGAISPEEFDKVKRKWNSEYRGVKNASKVALIRSADIDYQELSLGLDKVAIKEIKEMTREDVMFMFRVSKPMLGILQDVNLASAKTANYAFMQRVIKPKMKRLTDTLEQFIYDEGVRVKFKNPLKEDKNELADYYNKMINVGLTYNEVRAEMGLDPIENGNSLYIPMNLIPMGEPKPQAKGLIKTTTTRKVIKEQVETKQTTDIKQDDADIKLIHWKSMIGIRNAWLKRYEYSMDKIIQAEQKAVIARLKGKQKDVSSLLPDLTKAEEQWLLTMLPISMGLFADEAEYASTITGTPVTLGKAVEARLSERITRVFGGFDSARVDKLSKMLADCYLEGDSLSQMSTKITEFYKPYNKGGYESERLARTETKRIANEGALETYDQSEVVTGKEWYANPDACEFCQAMHGTIIDLESTFKEVGEVVTGTAGGSMAITFDKVDTADLHPNCECLLLPYSEEYGDTGNFDKTDDQAEVSE